MKFNVARILTNIPLVLALLLVSLFISSCGNGGTTSSVSNTYDGTSIGTLPNGSTIYVSSIDYTTVAGGTPESGLVGISGGTRHYATTIAFNPSILVSVGQSLKPNFIDLTQPNADSNGITISTTPSPCTIGTNTSLPSTCNLVISASSSTVAGTYSITPVATSYGESTVLSPLLITVNAVPSNAKSITSYSLNEVPGTISGQNISVIMPNGTNLNGLIATFTTTGAAVTINGVPQVSGTTANNFNESVTYVVTAADSSMADYIVNVTVNHPQFLYELSYLDSPLSQAIYTYVINTSNGLLIPTVESLAIPPDYAGNVASLKLSYNRAYAYALNEGNEGSVLMYAVNQSNGALSPLSESSVAAGFKPFSMALNQAGTFAYVITEDRESEIQVISMYNITNGILSPLSIPMLTTQSAPAYIAVTPNNKFAYVSNYSDNTLYSYKISESGLLQPLANESVIATGNVPFLVVTNPSGTNVYVINYSDSTISMYNINQLTGELTPLSPESTVATGQQSIRFQTFIITPSGSYAYINNVEDQTISMYSINGEGLLTPLAESIITTPNYISELTIDSSGNYLYAGSADSLIYIYNISESGLLIPFDPESAVTTVGIPVSVVAN